MGGIQRRLLSVLLAALAPILVLARDGLWRHCRFFVTMVDSHPIKTVSVLFEGSANFQLKAAVINYMYAKRHGYNFTYIWTKDRPPNFPYTTHWLKLGGIWQQVGHLGLRGCAWGIYLDSDAFFVNHDVRLEDVLGNISRQFGRPPEGPRSLEDVGLVVDRAPGSHAVLNTGVLLYNFRHTRVLLGNWFGASKDISQMCPEGETCEPCLPDQWPYEQGCLETLLGMRQPGAARAARRPGLKEMFGTVPLVGVTAQGTLNGPSGQYVKHLWGGAGGRYAQPFAWDEQLRLLGLMSTDRFNEVLWEIGEKIYNWFV